MVVGHPFGTDAERVRKKRKGPPGASKKMRSQRTLILLKLVLRRLQRGLHQPGKIGNICQPGEVIRNLYRLQVGHVSRVCRVQLPLALVSH
jgi:hypothetical protein